MENSDRFDVVAMGELLIDFTPVTQSGCENPTYEMNPGGAPANCLAALNALGAKTAFIGCVGKDKFGQFLLRHLQEIGIDTSGVRETDRTHTTLAFVHLEKGGERSFTFLRDPGADTLIEENAVDYSLIDRSEIFHFGSLSFTDQPARDAVLSAVEYARRHHKRISFDPNYRPLLWTSEKEAVKWIKKGIELADIVKMSEEELELITNCSEIERAVRIFEPLNKQMVLITAGEKGAYYFVNTKEQGFVPGFHVHAVDTTGCGDAFTGAILYQMIHAEHEKPSEMVRFANAVGALCATKKGGIPAMPKWPEIRQMIDPSDR